MNDIKELLNLASKGDKDARNMIVNENLNLIRSVAKKFLNRGYDFDELFQVGCIGLIKAVDKFDREYNVKFSTYAVPLIMGEIQRFIRDDNPVHISRSLKELSIRCLREKERIENDFNREAKVWEIANACNVSVYDVSEALNASCPPESIYREIAGDEGKSVMILDRIADEGQSDMFSGIMIEEAIKKLMPREKSIIRMRFAEDKTQAEISDILGISQVQVSRLLKKTLLEMRKNIE